MIPVSWSLAVARKRMIDPNLWEDQKLANCPWQARFVFIGLISHADDAGRLGGHPGILQSRIFHSTDGIKVDDMASWLDSLDNAGLIVRYETDGEQYIWLPGFHKHQQIQYPQQSSLPSPPMDDVKIHSGLIDSSMNPLIQEKRREEKRRGDKSPTPFNILVAYENHRGYRFPRKKRMPPGKELAASKTLIENNYTIEQICACHDWLFEQDPDFWKKQGGISLQSILKRLPLYVEQHPKTTKQALEDIPDL